MPTTPQIKKIYFISDNNTALILWGIQITEVKIETGLDGTSKFRVEGWALHNSYEYDAPATRGSFDPEETELIDPTTKPKYLKG